MFTALQYTVTVYWINRQTSHNRKHTKKM